MRSKDEIPDVEDKKVVQIKDTYNMGAYYERKSKSLTNIRVQEVQTEKDEVFEQSYKTILEKAPE